MVCITPIYPRVRPNYIIMGFILVVFSGVIASMVLPNETFVSGYNISVNASMIFMFLTLTSISIIFPWYLLLKRDDGYFFNSYHKHKLQDFKTSFNETAEYLITLVVPRKLQKTVYIETDDRQLYLKSKVDKNYIKKYNIPEGFDLDSLDYDYDGDFLIMKLFLFRERGF